MTMNDEQIEQLLKASGGRQDPDPQLAQDIRVATEGAWLAAVAAQRKQRQRQLWRKLSAVAAGLLVVLGVVATSLNRTAPSLVQTLAQVSFAQGQYQINLRTSTTFSSNSLQQGDVINTGADGLVNLTLHNQATLTLATNTQVHMVGPAHVQIVTGKIYIDSPGTQSQLVVDTEWGQIEDIGTQFEVTVTPSELQVAMREGQVKMALASGTHYANVQDGMGDVVNVDEQHHIQRSTLASNDPHWSWPLAALAPLDLEGLSLYQLMQWVSRATGKPVVYSAATVEQRAKQTRLSGGRLAAEDIDQALPLLLKTTSLIANIGVDKIEIDISSNN